MALRTRLLTYTGPLTPDRYDYFFNPNICHVCKSTNEGILELCECRMISYCSEVHKTMHRQYHMEICVLIAYMLRGNPWYYMRRLTITEWHKSKENLMKLVRKRMSRPLMQYEIEMLMFPKSCLICHRQTGLRACYVCFSANFCSDHSIDFHQFHRSDCKELLVSLNFALTIIGCQLNRKLLQFYVFPDKFRRPSNTLEFIGLYVHPRNELWTTDRMSAVDYYYSEYISDPLTLYHGMLDARLIDFLSKPVCVVHILNTNLFSPPAYLAWEMLLHLLCNKVQKMIIVLRGSVRNIESNKMETCAKCRLKKKVIIFENYPMLYKNYVLSTAYRYPDVIVGFQPQKCDITIDSLMILQKQDCPVLFTTALQFKAEQLATYINDTLNTVQPLLIVKNRFAGLMPRRNIDAEGVYYSNNHLIVYKNLRRSNELTHSRSLS